MSTKLSTKIKSILKKKVFNLEHESKMAQARILSPFIEVIEDNNITQLELQKLTGLKQPFISGLFNQQRKLNMEHIALFQEALGIKLQPPAYLTEHEHNEKFYSDKQYIPAITHFLDSCEFKNDYIVRWIDSNKLTSSIENEGYSVINSGCLSDKLFEENQIYTETDETF